jgi:hypothetical protein
MFNDIINDPANELLRDRLNRVLSELRTVSLSTREEYLAEMYSRVNRVLSIGNHMAPLTRIPSEGPASVGDVIGNLQSMNQDAVDIAQQILRVEDSAARLYNLAASTQNSLRQTIRESLFASSALRFIEAFIHERQIDSHTANIDFESGCATLPVLDEQVLSPVITIGSNSVGTVLTGSDALTDSQIGSALVFNGTSLELIITFAQPEIVNRLQLVLDDYEGLEITSLTSSPDGLIFEDVLADLGVRTILMNGRSGKFAGSVIVDFPPRHASSIRLVIEDRVNVARIALRAITLSRKRYSSAGILTSKPITSPIGPVTFSVVSQMNAPLTDIIHQISSNGVHFSAIQPGNITIGSPLFWYRANFQRTAKAFDSQQSPLIPNTGDPAFSPNYTINRVSTVPLGENLIERTIVLENVTGPVTLRETPIGKSFQVQEGAVFLTTDDFTLNNNVLSFSVPKSIITIVYQVSSIGSAALSDRQEFYTPILSEVRFES